MGCVNIQLLFSLTRDKCRVTLNHLLHEDLARGQRILVPTVGALGNLAHEFHGGETEHIAGVLQAELCLFEAARERDKRPQGTMFSKI